MNSALAFERHATQSSLLTSQFFKNSLFQFFNLLLLPIFAYSTVAELIGTLSTRASEATWYSIIGSAVLVQSGTYYAQYLIHSIFVYPGMALLDLPTYLSKAWRLRTALTEADFKSAAGVVTSAGTAYDSQLAIFGVLLFTCISVPLLLPFGLIYLLAKYNIDMYMMRNFKVTNRYNKGTIRQ